MMTAAAPRSSRRMRTSERNESHRRWLEFLTLILIPARTDGGAADTHAVRPPAIFSHISGGCGVMMPNIDFVARAPQGGWIDMAMERFVI